MAAKKTRSSVFGLKAETTAGTYIDLGATTDFTTLREGFTFQSGVNTVDSDELVNDIGASEGFVTSESPSGSVPKYFKHSGTEGQAPDYALLIKSAMGSQTTNATQYNTVAGSTAGTSAARATVVVDAGEGASFAEGQALLIKDGTNGYNIRNVDSISTDTLSLNFNLASAPGTAVDLGKAIQFAPAISGHPTFTAHHYQASSSSALHQAIVGCRTTNMSIEFPANELATCTFDFEGIGFYTNPMVVTASNKYIDFNIDGVGTDFSAQLTVKAYKSPKDMAREVAIKMSAASSATISCDYDSTTGKFTISKASGTLQILWNTGTNTANGAHTLLGFSAAADSTGALTYTSATAQTYSPSYTPAYDSSNANVVRYNELLIGGFARKDNKSATNVSFTVSTPVTSIPDLTAETGIGENLINQRTATFSATLIFQEHEMDQFDALVNNSTTSVMFNHGPKSGGNWVAGSCVNIYMPNAKVTSHVVSDSDGFLVVEIECKGFVNTDKKDVHINFV
jgi:hypothetical protein